MKEKKPVLKKNAPILDKTLKTTLLSLSLKLFFLSSNMCEMNKKLDYYKTDRVLLWKYTKVEMFTYVWLIGFWVLFDSSDPSFLYFLNQLLINLIIFILYFSSIKINQLHTLFFYATSASYILKNIFKTLKSISINRSKFLLQTTRFLSLKYISKILCLSK